MSSKTRDPEFETTERVAQNFTTTTKLMLTRFGRKQIHKYVDLLADELQHRPEYTDEGIDIIKDPMTHIDRELGETEKNIIKLLTDKERILAPSHR